MAIRFGYVLLTTLFSVLICGTCRITSVKYRPYGPMKCLQICQHSTDTSSSIQRYNCFRVSGIQGTRAVDDSFICMQEEKTVSSTVPSVSHGQARNKGESTVVESLHLSTKSMPTEDKKKYNVQCNNAINLPKACEKGELDEIENILSQGHEDINCRSKYGRTPVMVATRKRQERVFDFLVSKGCDLFAVDDFNDNVLHIACIGGSTYIVKKLVEDKTFDIDVRGRYGRTPVMAAGDYCKRKEVELLVRYGCDLTTVDKSNDTILHYACARGCEDVVEYILSRDVISIESRGQYGLTPVLISTMDCSFGAMNLLIHKGCNLNAVDNDMSNILHWACKTDCIEKVKYILSRQVIDIDSRGEKGKTPVMFAIESGHKQVVDLLISKGCNLGLVDNDGDTVLHSACLGGHVEMVKYLISLPEIEREGENNYGETPRQLTENDEIAALFQNRWQ